MAAPTEEEAGGGYHSRGMFERILIANRGEIALRVLRPAREMGIECVAVYSDFDRSSLHARLADEAVALGGSLPSESYLDMEKILAAAERTGAQDRDRQLDLRRQLHRPASQTEGLRIPSFSV